ncbi:DNA repair protein RadC [Arcticibacter tournemirensis]|uniref:JAB domain-containing protein n=1 Tax=Arcticibacter tournemirensis TaxID=699437 RepID=A0A5M9H0K0_9SPHI|nr:JAB domain-containing protein [Arcticibacter tournemirensis]KAA8480100.1 JAB domain-containing protein [Arcticibacter tournemirensis]TQM50704.1 DNA repair protein RadC [Arcticibacter tournemirensis]
MEKRRNQLALYQVAEIQVSYFPKFKASERPVITGAKSAFEILMANWDQGKIQYVEQFKVILLSRGNRVLGIFEASTGGVSGTIADPKVIFGAALKANCSSVIISHNHPSSSLKPSQADINLTRKLASAGEMLDMPVLDHIIVTADGFFSFADEGLL